MATIKVEVGTDLPRSFRVEQVAGLFDVPLEDRLREAFEVELPGDLLGEGERDWRVGLIVGPSGSGKSTVARQVFGEQLVTQPSWPKDRAVVDAFGELPVRRVVELLTAVGFGSPPSWVKPYHVLSNGERFRCDLARSLARGFDTQGSPLANPPIVAFDEFTSVVDRNVARATSAAIGKGVRAGRLPTPFVGVTCHYDVADWLEADWVLDMSQGTLTRRSLRRPEIELEVHRCELEAWRLFARHHYLSGSLALQSRCYLATWRGEPVAFAATLPVIARRGHRRFTRIVTLPDYQGLGIGTHLIRAVCEIHQAEGHRMSLTTSHPGLIDHARRAPHWRARNVKRNTKPQSKDCSAFAKYRNSSGRVVVSFEYVPVETSAS